LSEQRTEGWAPSLNNWIVALVGLCAAGLYAGAFFPAHVVLGPHAVHLATLPVLAVALLSGMRIGLLAAGLSLPLSALLLDLVGAPTSVFLNVDLGSVHMALLILTALMGREVDLGRRVADEQQLRARAERTLARNQALIDALPDDIYLVAADGSMREAHGMLSEEEAPQRSVGDADTGAGRLLPPPTHRVEDELETVLTKGDPRRIEFTASRGAKVYELEARLVRVGDDEALAIVRDLTDLKRLKEQAVRDGLTGLYNHRFFQETLKREVARARRHQHEVSLLFIDVDHFKHFNDTHGHPAGDALLRQLGRILGNTGDFEDVDERGRLTDIPARYGGEEFIIILPETPTAGATIRADRLRRCVADFPFPGREQQPLGTVSISIGVASYPPHGDSFEHLIEAADKALYEAKETGRNRVRVSKAGPAQEKSAPSGEAEAEAEAETEG